MPRTVVHEVSGLASVDRRPRQVPPDERAPRPQHRPELPRRTLQERSDVARVGRDLGSPGDVGAFRVVGERCANDEEVAVRHRLACMGSIREVERVDAVAEAMLDDGWRQAQRMRAVAGDVAANLRGHAGVVQDEIAQHPVASVTAGFVIGLLIGRFFMR